MQKYLKLFTVLIAGLLLISSFASCSENDSDQEKSETTVLAASSDVQTLPEETRETLYLPDKTFGGRTFTVLVPTQLNYDFCSNEYNGESVNDAVYVRNIQLETQFDIKFNFFSEDDSWTNRAKYNDKIRASVHSGAGEYDLVSGVISCVIPATGEGLFLDVSELEHINLDKVWWVKDLFDDLSINGRLYATVGDGLLSLYKQLNVMYCNTDLLEKYTTDIDIYQIVREGLWTIDKMAEIGANVRADTNGDSKMDPLTDTFGFVSINVPNRSWPSAFGVKVIERDLEGNLGFTDLSERFLDTYNKLYNIFSVNDNFWVDPSATNKPDIYFSEGRALFLLSYLNATETLKSMSDDYCIIPMPKYDTNQESYHTQVGTSSAMFFVPSDVKDSELTSMVCEALCYYNHFDVVPVYYDDGLKAKYARDENVIDMLDIIRDSATLSFQYAYSSEFSPMIFTIFEMTQAKMDKYAGAIASYYSSNQKVWEATLKRLVKTYALLD